MDEEQHAMPPTRRQFIKRFGVMLASLIVARCAPARTRQSNEQETPIPTNIPPTSTSPCTNSDKPHCTDWNRLRQCWLDMSDSHTHLVTLEVLVEAGEIDQSIADQIQIAFTEATIHVGIERSGATCYAEMPVEYVPRTNLVMQIDTLREIADDLDPVVVERVQDAISRDITFLETWSALQTQKLDQEESIAKIQELILQFNSDTLQASPEAVKAADILVKLVLGEIE